MDAVTRGEISNRLKSVEGHIRGVLQMLDEDRPCLDLVRHTQAIQGSIRQVSLLLLTQHLDLCLRETWGKPEPAGYQQVRDELLSLFSQKV